MKKKQTALAEIKLVGITVRTNNRDEMNPEKGKISTVASQYWGGKLGDNIKHRSNPGVTYAVYTEFESDQNGEYTYFIGEVVNSFDNQDLTQFKQLTIPASKYQKFTTESGEMPSVLINSWVKIWEMTEADFGGKRKYIADFEVYDDKAIDPKNTAVDIYIGIH